jgi:hypothetical protein
MCAKDCVGEVEIADKDFHSIAHKMEEKSWSVLPLNRGGGYTHVDVQSAMGLFILNF